MCTPYNVVYRTSYIFTMGPSSYVINDVHWCFTDFTLVVTTFDDVSGLT